MARSSQARFMGGSKTIRGNMEPDPNWKIVGQLDTGAPIYEEVQPRYEKRQAVDPVTGKAAFFLNAQQQPIRPRMENVWLPDEAVQFTLHDLGNGTVKRNYYFRDESPRVVQPVDAVREELAELRAELAAHKQAATKPTPKRKPGRPKGSRNKAKVNVGETASVSAVVVEGATTDVTEKEVPSTETVGVGSAQSEELDLED